MRAHVVVAGVLAVVVFGSAAFGDGAYHAVVREDGPLEWAQFAGFAAAAVWFARAARDRRAVGDRAWPALLLFAVGFVLVAGEEAAWGQRLFDLRVDAVQRANRQDELTLHNLGDNLSLSWLAFALLALFGTAAATVRRRLPRALGRLIGAVAPARELRWWFLPGIAYAIARISVLSSPSYNVAKASEYFELAVAIGFACAARASAADPSVARLSRLVVGRPLATAPR